MAKKETNPKRCIAETKKQISRVIDDKTRSDLLEKFNNLGSARSGYSQYKETILNELSVSLAQLTTWAKDFYIGFNGQKTLDECLDLAYELERKSRDKIIKSIKDEERNFSFDLVEKVKKEFFGGKDTMSLKATSEIFFKDATSKEIQGKRVRGQDAIFDRLLDCTFSGSVELFSPEYGIELWHIAAGVPFGVSVAFLISSPLISEIAAIMLLGMGAFGVYIVSIYILSGTVISILAGYLADKYNVERYLSVNIPKTEQPTCGCKSLKEKTTALIKYANGFACNTVKSLAVYILIGLAVGAFMHGYIPQEFFVKYLGADNLWAVPVAAIAGIPIYASQAGIVPLVQVLLEKGVPVGTALVAFMSIAAISLPEMMMLKKVFTYKLLILFVGYLLVAFIITGYVLNFLST